VTATVIDGRKERNRLQLASLTRWCATILALPALVVLLVVAVVFQHVIAGIVAGIVVWAVVSALVYRHVRRFGSALVAGLPRGEVDDRTAARLRNLTDGLCVAHGVTRPTITVVNSESRNAATVLLGEHDRDVALLVTAGLASSLSRIELEGMIAQQLAHVRDGDVALSTFVAAVASVPLIGPLLGRRAGACLDPHLETSADLAAAAMTRYPPGLAAALSRLTEAPNHVLGVAPGAAHLWVAHPLAPDQDEPFLIRPPLADRIEVLSEL
jgi:heat shock protein HtpX